MRADSPIHAAAGHPAVAALAAGALIAAGASAAHAQGEAPRTLDPSGDTPVQRGAPPDPYSPPRQPAREPAQPSPPAQGSADGADSGAAEESGYYHYDGILGRSRGGGTSATRPDRHEVSRGDTLWDITARYFGDPFEWPKVWSRNPHITNPHWIYPGDEVQLRDPDGGGQPEPAGEPAAVATTGNPPPAESSEPVTDSFRLRQVAFVERDELEVAAELVGAPSERTLLSNGDTVYLDGADSGGLQPGERYAIYTDAEEVVHPHSGEVVGAYVELLGELEVTGSRAGERTIAEITSSVNVVERGARVGRLPHRFASVDAAPARADVTGAIIATIEIGELVAEDHLVVIDRGAGDGVEPGNPLYVVRRGDGYTARMGRSSGVGQDDEDYPTRIVGHIRAVEVSEEISIGLVTSSALEVGVGDHVIMRRNLE